MNDSNVEHRASLLDRYPHTFDRYPYISAVVVNPADECAIVAFADARPDLRLLGTHAHTDAEWIVVVACASPEVRSEFEYRAM